MSFDSLKTLTLSMGLPTEQHCVIAPVERILIELVE
jgi:hypothetical protein